MAAERAVEASVAKVGLNLHTQGSKEVVFVFIIAFKDYADQLKITFFETSAKNSTNVEQVHH